MLLVVTNNQFQGEKSISLKTNMRKIMSMIGDECRRRLETAVTAPSPFHASFTSSTA